MRLLVLAIFLVACGGGSDPAPAIDAPDQPVDAAIDAGQLPACTGAVYDPCTMNEQCQSQICHRFDSAGIQICNLNCNAQNPCPDFNGQPVTCNMMGRCNPREQNMCMR